MFTCLRNVFVSVLSITLTVIMIMSTQLNSAHAATKRIAVMTFENNATSLSSSSQADMLIKAMLARRGVQDDSNDKERIRRSVTDTFMTEIVKDGMFTLVERNQLDKILSEQKMTTSGLLDKSDAAKLGRLLGVSAIVMGTINQYSIESHKKGILGVGVKSNIGKVAVNVRIVDATTGEILLAANGKGEEEVANVRVGSIYSGDSSIAETLMGKATQKALMEIITNIKSNSAKFKDNIISGKIAYCDSKDQTFIVNVGSDKGLTKDQTLYVKKVIKEITDTETNEVLKTICETIAEVKIKDIEAKTATAVCTKGRCGEIKEKDFVSSVAIN